MSKCLGRMYSRSCSALAGTKGLVAVAVVFTADHRSENMRTLVLQSLASTRFAPLLNAYWGVVKVEVGLVAEEKEVGDLEAEDLKSNFRAWSTVQFLTSQTGCPSRSPGMWRDTSILSLAWLTTWAC